MKAANRYLGIIVSAEMGVNCDKSQSCHFLWKSPLFTHNSSTGQFDRNRKVLESSLFNLFVSKRDEFRPKMPLGTYFGGVRGSQRAQSRGEIEALHQRTWILTHFTAEISSAHKARPNGCRGPWCGATTSGPPHRSEGGRERARDRGLRWGKTARHEMSQYPRPLVLPPIWAN